MLRGSSGSPSAALDSASMRGTLRSLCDVLMGRARRLGEWGPQEWSRVAEAAEGHGVAPLLCRSLDDVGWPEAIPAPVRKRLRRAHFSTAANNLLFYGELSRVLDALRREAAERDAPMPAAVVLKGGDLALSLYPSLALRPMADLDLLVPRESWGAAVHVLEGLGYRKALPEIARGHDAIKGSEAVLIGGPHDRVLVELHWGLIRSDLDRRSPPLTWFWERIEEIKYQRIPRFGSRPEHGTRVDLPSSFFHFQPTANLLYLAAHIVVQHGVAEAKLLWFHDLHLLVTRFGESIDWNGVLEQAIALGWNVALFAALEGTRDYFDTPIPGGVFEALGRRQPTQSLRPLEPRPDLPKGLKAWTDFVCLSWRGRIRYARNHFFPTRAYMQWRYKARPKWLWPLCYPYRWWVILYQGLTAFGYRTVRGQRSSARGHVSTRRDVQVARALREVASEQPLRLRVTGDCMAPWVNPGARVEVSGARFLFPGDVIAFRQNGQVKLHRLIGYRPTWRRLGLVTQGDGNPSCDLHSDLDDVIGRVSGGDCSRCLVEIPLRHRLWALGRFIGHVCKRFFPRKGVTS